LIQINMETLSDRGNGYGCSTAVHRNKRTKNTSAFLGTRGGWPRERHGTASSSGGCRINGRFECADDAPLAPV